MTAGSLLFATALLHAQAFPGSGEWRRIGGTTLSLGLASPAGGPVERVWYSADGATLFARTASGAIWTTSDFEKWVRATPETTAAPAGPAPSPAVKLPEEGTRALAHPLQQNRMYAAGEFAWRSDDGGANWTNLTAHRGSSILGGRLTDLTVSPANTDDVVVAGANGIWRSVDGGASWTGLNDNLPNLPVARLLAVPGTETVTRVQVAGGAEMVWMQGERAGWQPAEAVSPALAAENALKASAPGTNITAAVRGGEWAYAGTADGRLLVSADRGRTWRESPGVAGVGSIRRIASDPRDGRFAIAVTASPQASGRVLRTTNGGVFWDDISSDLPSGQAYGVAVERLTGAVYLASASGLFVTFTDPVAASPATPWSRLRPESTRDVLLDSAGNQLYVALEGSGVFATMAPHRMRDPRVVSAGDRILRAAAPGSVLSVIGARIQSARAGDRAATVLAAGDTESQVQLPWDLAGNAVLVSLTTASGNIQLGLPLAETSPSIFVDRDGSPLISSGDTGLMLDAATPARSSGRLQILASGLGRVTPSWPAGLAAPLQDPPKVNAPVRAWLDREPVEVIRATLAPGYAGMYLVEIQLPSIVNRGPAELYLDAGSAQSNRVRIWLEP